VKKEVPSIKITNTQSLISIPHVPPLLLQTDGLTAIGLPSAEKVQVLVGSKAFLNINSHIGIDISREVGGILIGAPYNWQEKLYVEIIDSLSVKVSSSSAIHLEISSEIWSNTITTLSEKFPEKYLVGWYHTHPRNQIFFSDPDISIHKNFFMQFWHVALVLEPVKKKTGFFIWDTGNIRKSKGYYVNYPPDIIPSERWVSDN
jgi:proteasome lid subunit RPN8/RPN11